MKMAEFPPLLTISIGLKNMKVYSAVDSYSIITEGAASVDVHIMIIHHFYTKGNKLNDFQSPSLIQPTTTFKG